MFFSIPIVQNTNFIVQPYTVIFGGWVGSLSTMHVWRGSRRVVWGDAGPTVKRNYIITH